MTDPASKPQKHHTTQKVQMLVTLALFVGLGIGIVTVGLATRSGHSSQPSASSPAPQTAVSGLHSVGEAATNNNVKFSVDKVTVDTTGDGVYTPNNGNKFVIVDVTFGNMTTTTHPVVPITQVYLKDADGNTYYISPAPMKSPLNAGNLLAGDNLRGQLSFEVPSTAKSLKLYFDPGWENIQPFVYQLNTN